MDWFTGAIKRQGRVVSARRYLKKWQELIPVSSIMMQLATCVAVMLLFAHFAACMLILAAKLEGLPEGSWLVIYGAPLLCKPLAASTEE